STDNVEDDDGFISNSWKGECDQDDRRKGDGRAQKYEPSPQAWPPQVSCMIFPHRAARNTNLACSSMEAYPES
ncbi:MAG: hypothetical protein ABI142_12320, partial [Bryocella sp.]